MEKKSIKINCYINGKRTSTTIDYRIASLAIRSYPLLFDGLYDYRNDRDVKTLCESIAVMINSASSEAIEKVLISYILRGLSRG